MAQSYLIFDFETNEDAAQQARHRLESWKQAFRLGKKIELKFEREPVDKAGDSGAAKKETPAKKQKASETSAESESPAKERIRLIIRLDFSDHEKLSHRRWLDRIPAEEPFKSTEHKLVRHSDEAFASTAELFDTLK